MSPEHASINEVPKDLRRELKIEVERLGLSYKRLVHGGFAFCRNGKVDFVLSLDEISESQKRDPKREKSDWHIVCGL